MQCSCCGLDEATLDRLYNEIEILEAERLMYINENTKLRKELILLKE